MPKHLGATYWKAVAGRLPEGLGEAYRDRLACPDDDAVLGEIKERGEEFLCPACERRFAVSNGILSALPTSDQYMLDIEERAALEEKAPANPWVDNPGDEFQPVWESLESRAGSLKGRRVLDLCCGSGWAAHWFAKKGARVAAVDYVAGEGGLKTLLEKAGNVSGSIDCFQADICRLPFVEETFDIIFIGDTLHTLHRPEILVLEAARVLITNGLLLNMNEPISSSGLGRLGSTDPRREGRQLTLGDYKAIYAEAGLSFEVAKRGDDFQRGKLKALLGRLGPTSSEDVQFFIARKPRRFSLADFTLTRKA